MREYIVLLTGLKGGIHNIFWNGDKLFTLKEAIDFIAFSERLYFENKGDYKIFKLTKID